MSLHPDVCANGQLRRTILLVEDEPFVLDATSRILARAGFEVLTAQNAQDAIEIFESRNGQINLLMTDMILPGRTGQELGQRLRERAPALAVLVTSGYCNPEYESETPESRTYFLAKPYSRPLLLEKIDQILSPQMKAEAATQSG